MAGSFACLAKLTTWITQHSRTVLALWCLLAFSLIGFAPKFMDEAGMSFDPPRGSKSAEAMAQMKEYMPQFAQTTQFAGIVEDAEGDIVSLPGIAKFADALARDLNASGRLLQILPTAVMLNTPKLFGPPPLVVSADGASVLFIWTTGDEPTSLEAREWADVSHGTFMSAVERHRDAYNLAGRIAYYGTSSLPEAVSSALIVAKADMERVDMISMPLAMLILFNIVRSGRLLLVTGFALSVSTICACALLYFLSCVITVEAMTPPLVMGVLVGMSIDYSLFILTRFRKELLSARTGRDMFNGPVMTDAEIDAYHAVLCKTMSTSGATIVVSGVCLAVACIYVTLFPVNIVASMGLGCVLALCILMLVNLSLVPALLATFPRFFSKSVEVDNSRCASRCQCRHRTLAGAGQDEQPGHCWRKIAAVTTSKPWNYILLAIVASLTAALSTPILRMRITNDLRQALAHGSDLYELAERLEHGFGGGAIVPYNVMLRPTDDTAIFSNKFFEQSGACLRDVQRELVTRMPDANRTSFFFMSYVSTSMALRTPIMFPAWQAMCWLPLKAPGCSLLNEFTDTDDYLHDAPKATIGMIIPGVDPMTNEGAEFLTILRQTFDKYGSQQGIEASITGTGAYAADMSTSIQEFFPLMMVATLGTAMLVMGITFRSVVIPIRAVVSNCLTLGFAYGTTILVYQDGCLDFLGWSAVSGELKALPVLVPAMIFFILTGLGLDYDIFLSSRVTELRASGLPPQEAIREGLLSTASIITSAGLVMVVALGALMFSSMLQLNMTGFMMVVAVLYDTFVARTIVNPAVMSLLGAVNWWPSSLSHLAIEADQKMPSLLMSMQEPPKASEDGWGA